MISNSVTIRPPQGNLNHRESLQDKGLDTTAPRSSALSKDFIHRRKHVVFRKIGMESENEKPLRCVHERAHIPPQTLYLEKTQHHKLRMLGKCWQYRYGKKTVDIRRKFNFTIKI